MCSLFGSFFCCRGLRTLEKLPKRRASWFEPVYETRGGVDQLTPSWREWYAALSRDGARGTRHIWDLDAVQLYRADRCADGNRVAFQYSWRVLCPGLETSHQKHNWDLESISKHVICCWHERLRHGWVVAQSDMWAWKSSRLLLKPQRPTMVFLKAHRAIESDLHLTQKLLPKRWFNAWDMRSPCL